MNIKDTYFGFTNHKKPLQAGKIEKSLDMQWRYKGKIYERKVLVYNMLKEGNTPLYRENHTYYSKRTDGYTKPRTLYKLEDKNGSSYLEINKTLYDYTNYLLENNFTDGKVAEQFIHNEIAEKEKKERLEQEHLEKEKEYQEKQKEKEDQDRKERLEHKQKEWSKIGEQLLNNFETNPIVEVLNYHWKEIKSIYKDEKKENFYNNMTERFTKILGNKNYCIYWLQGYIENENDPDEYKKEYTIKNYSLRKLEKDILFKTFNNVSLNDKRITIIAKVKAVFENREYKGSKTPKQYKFYYSHIDKVTGLKEFKESYGQKFIIDDYTCFMRTIEADKYSMVEAKTGLGVSGGFSSKSETIKQAKESVNKNKDKLNQIIKSNIEKHGISPLYQDQKAI